MGTGLSAPSAIAATQERFQLKHNQYKESSFPKDTQAQHRAAMILGFILIYIFLIKTNHMWAKIDLCESPAPKHSINSY